MIDRLDKDLVEVVKPKWVGLTEAQEIYLAHQLLIAKDDVRNDGRTVYRIIKEAERLLKEANA